MSLYRWQERDFESTSLTDDSWANVVFRSRPSTLATKTRKRVFHFIFFLKEKSTWSTAQLYEFFSKGRVKKHRNYTGQQVKKTTTESMQGNKWKKPRKYTGQQVTPPPEIIQGENYIGWTTEIIQREKQKLYRATKFPGVITRQSKQDCLLGGSGTDAVSNPLI